MLAVTVTMVSENMIRLYINAWKHTSKQTSKSPRNQWIKRLEIYCSDTEFILLEWVQKYYLNSEAED